MPPVQAVRAVLTNRGANMLAQITQGKILPTGMKHFRIGEGGFTTFSGTKYPNDPDKVTIDIQADDPALIPGLTTALGHVPYVFQKSFVDADFTIEGSPPVVFKVSPLLDFGEANDNGVGGSPRFMEIGLYFVNSIPSQQILTGTGVSGNFIFTLAAAPVTASTFSMTFGAYTVTDNGAGGLVGAVDGGGTNTIDYRTGAINVTFSPIPWLGQPIMAAYSSTPLMYYGTFPEEIKTAMIQLTKVARIAY